jgi:hypothetical protein
MKNLFAIILVFIALTPSYSQKKQKIPPPIVRSVPPPPSLEPPFEETQKLKADPLKEYVITFWTDTIYLKTDSSFQSVQRNFSPSGLGAARLTKEVSFYPKRYTRDSLVENGNRVVAVTKETYSQDGEYLYNKKLPKESDRLIFTDKKTKQRTVFIINWEGQGGDKKIVSLIDESTKTNWKAGNPPAVMIMGN